MKGSSNIYVRNIHTNLRQKDDGNLALLTSREPVACVFTFIDWFCCCRGEDICRVWLGDTVALATADALCF